jgi:hypothetical protein
MYNYYLFVIFIFFKDKIFKAEYYLYFYSKDKNNNNKSLTIIRSWL